MESRGRTIMGQTLSKIKAADNTQDGRGDHTYITCHCYGGEKGPRQENETIDCAHQGLVIMNVR